MENKKIKLECTHDYLQISTERKHRSLGSELTAFNMRVNTAVVYPVNMWVALK